MPLSLARIILSLCLYLSLVRSTNIALFYPSDETMIGTIDFTYQTLLTAFLLAGMGAYFFLTNNLRIFASAASRSLVALVILGAIVTLGLSVDKVQSLKFMIAVTAISLPGIVYINEYGPEKLLEAVARFCVGLALVNFAYIIALPQYGIMSGIHSGKWRGLLEHKNSFGPFCAISFYFILHQLQRRNALYLGAQLLALILSFVFVIKAQSSTGYVAFAGMGFFYVSMLFVYRFRAGWERLAIILVSVSLFALLLFLAGHYIEAVVFDLTGKDATLTGRTGIWKVVFDELIDRRPFTGYGPGMSERAGFMEQIQGGLNWDAKGTHNSYLDLLINYGYPETILIMLLIFKIWARSFLAHLTTIEAVRLQAFASCLVFVILVMSFANAGALFSRSIFSFFMIAALMIMSYPKLEKSA